VKGHRRSRRCRKQVGWAQLVERLHAWSRRDAWIERARGRSITDRLAPYPALAALRARHLEKLTSKGAGCSARCPSEPLSPPCWIRPRTSSSFACRSSRCRCTTCGVCARDGLACMQLSPSHGLHGQWFTPQRQPNRSMSRTRCPVQSIRVTADGGWHAYDELRLEGDTPLKLAEKTNLEYLEMLDPDRLVWSFRRQAGLPVVGEPYRSVRQLVCLSPSHAVWMMTRFPCVLPYAGQVRGIASSGLGLKSARTLGRVFTFKLSGLTARRALLRLTDFRSLD
jgi:hypothetical protein